jgi:aldehyde dehydrogenase (NAD+)
LDPAKNRKNSCWYLTSNLALGIASCSIEYQPLGLVLVISAWNYPIYTALPQVAAAIAAGNSVILKPSELAPYTSNALKKLFNEYLDPSTRNKYLEYYRCI